MLRQRSSRNSRVFVGQASDLPDDQGIVEGKELESNFAWKAQAGFSPVIDRNVARPASRR